MLDATTAVEDQFFWTNPGFDPSGIISAGLDTLSGRPRGASTITQQLVRARLLPAGGLRRHSTYERKVREIIQSIRLTEAYPGDEGKQDIITAYLNQNFYGNQTYGVKAAARGYFGKSLKDLTLAQFAILAAIPQSPTKFDLMRNAEEVCLDETRPTRSPTRSARRVQLEVPLSSEIVQRRNYILDLMKTRSPLSGVQAQRRRVRRGEGRAGRHQAAGVGDLARAPVRVAGPRGLTSILCPDDPTDCEKVDTGGYRVTTTLDWGMQKIAEKCTYVAARAPHSSNPRKVLRDNKIPRLGNGAGSSNLRGQEHPQRGLGGHGLSDRRGARVRRQRALHGKGNKKFQPQFDVLSDGWRQPGSSIKPIDYSIGIDDET